MSGEQIGVLPLVCVVCEQPVGVINTPALAEMLDCGEAYICTACAGLIDDEDAGGIARFLEGCAPEHYLHLVQQALTAR